MKISIAFNKYYFLATVALFIIELIIVLFIKDRFVRPYVGDFLVVILIYCFVKSFWKVDSVKLTISVFLFATLVEVGQYFRLVELLGLKHSEIASIVIGTGFDWWDLIAYFLGVVVALGLDSLLSRSQI